MECTSTHKQKNNENVNVLRVHDTFKTTNHNNWIRLVSCYHTSTTSNLIGLVKAFGMLHGWCLRQKYACFTL